MRIVADEHVPPAFVTALRGEGHDVSAVGEAVELGSDDAGILDYAREHGRIILSEDVDFRGGDPALDLSAHPGVLACDTTATPGEVAAAVRRIAASSDDLSDTVLFVPGEWV
jgi:predicted nuclease of predicted toxin-antitoxin system